MGGGHSKFDQNNWFKANGTLTSAAETIDGAAPTSQYCVYWITKRAGRTKYVVNQRDFDVVDGERNLMYSTSAVPGTLLYFDVLGPGLEDYKLRVISDLARRHWTVYRYGTPTFPGQVHDHDATLQLTQEHSPDGIRRFPSGHAPKLYKVCGITVSWSRYAAVAVMFGPPQNPNASISNSSDHHATPGDDDDDETEDGSHGSGSALPHAPTDENLPNDKEITDKAVEASKEVSPKEGDEEPQLVTELASVEDTVPLAASPTSPLKDDSPVKGDAEDAGTPIKESTVAVDVPTPTSTATTPTAAEILKPNKSLDMFLEMENSNRGSNSNNRRRNESGDSGSVTSAGSKSTKGSIKSSLSSVLAASSSLRATQQLPSWLFSKAKKASHHTATASSSATSTSYMSHNPMEGVLQMDRPLLQCQEIFTHLIGTHQTMLISKEQVVQMLKDDAAKEREAAHKRGENHEEENVEVRLEDAEALFSGQPIPAAHDQQQHEAEAVTVTKEEKEEITVAETAPAAVISKEITENAEPPSVAPDDSAQDGSASATGDSPEEGSASAADGAKDVATDAATATEGATEVSAMDDAALLAEPLPGTEEDEEQPLVGYWIWENSLYTHKMKMHLAKNSDLALHVVLAVIVNQVRYERNAIALTI